MGRRSRAIGLCIGLVVAAPAAADDSALARAHLRGPAPGEAAAVFFLPIDGEPGAVAVGAAHSFDGTRLAEAGEVEFRLEAEGSRVTGSTRYYTRPGRAFHEPGATLRDDFVVFALAERPRGVHLLQPAESLPRPGARVRILGADAVAGSVARSDETRIEVDLDGPADLRGWGGAPVVEDGSGRVVGLLQSVWPGGAGLRAGVGPIGGVLEAIAQPLDGGLGRLFAHLAPPASAATGHGERRRAATGSPFGAAPPDQSAAEADAASRRGLPDPSPRSLRLEIEQPRPDAILGDAAGAFVAGRALALRDETRRFDIAIVVDTSGSTKAPTGVDVDGDGVLGEPGPDPLAGFYEPVSSDPDDSILAAEVAAARKLLAGLDPRSTRAALVVFAGEPVPVGPAFLRALEVRRAALTEEPLTSDYRRLSQALDRVRERGALGKTHMAAGIDQATVELLGLAGSLSTADPTSEKIVLFFTDGVPTLPYGTEADNVRAVLLAAERAGRAGVRIHSFAIGPEALEGPISTVEMAAITSGIFTPVRDPGNLVPLMEGVSFANVEAVQVANASTGEGAFQVRVHADGSWDALVPLATGRNELEVRARSGDGAEATERVTVHYAPGGASPFVPAELVSKRNQLLEARLLELRHDRQEAERRRAQEVRRELTLEIERERAAATQRAERQRKELELEVEIPAPGAPLRSPQPSR